MRWKHFQYSRTTDGWIGDVWENENVWIWMSARRDGRTSSSLLPHQCIYEMLTLKSCLKNHNHCMCANRLSKHWPNFDTTLLPSNSLSISSLLQASPHLCSCSPLLLISLVPIPLIFIPLIEWMCQKTVRELQTMCLDQCRNGWVSFGRESQSLSDVREELFAFHVVNH